MSTSAIVAPSFEQAILEATKREEAARLLEEQEKAAQAAQRAARLAEKNAENTKQKAAAEQREDIARAARKQRYLTRDVNRFVAGFADAVSKTGRRRGWKVEALKLAQSYVEALVSHEEVELPKIDPTTAGVIHGSFAYGMFLYLSKAKPVNIPEDYFVGQRQEWFPDLLAEKTR